MSGSLISAKEPDISIPQVRRIVVETKGAQIVQEESPAVGFALPVLTVVVGSRGEK